MKLKAVCKVFFGKIAAWHLKLDKQYLSGRWFTEENNYIGWNWVIRTAKERRNSGVNLNVPWPVSSRSQVVGARNIIFDPDDLNNFQHFGCYFQGKGKIVIGKGTYIAPNVGIITANHDLTDLDKNAPPKDVVIGEKSWIGMNSMILPGVCLGPHTVVGAGSVVTKSFVEGYCVLAGNPAREIKKIEEEH